MLRSRALNMSRDSSACRLGLKWPPPSTQAIAPVLIICRSAACVSCLTETRSAHTTAPLLYKPLYHGWTSACLACYISAFKQFTGDQHQHNVSVMKGSAAMVQLKGNSHDWHAPKIRETVQRVVRIWICLRGVHDGTCRKP